MYRTIVLAYDGTPACEAALQQAAQLASQQPARLHLLGIAVTTGGMTLAESVGGQDAWAPQEAARKRQLAAAAAGLRAQGLELVEAVRSGDPAAQIIGYAQEVGADLIVLGHSGKGAVTRWLQGSVGVQLLDRLPCSLLIAKP
jgi:nucleotide-binding universal stress UspA family protein